MNRVLATVNTLCILVATPAPAASAELEDTSAEVAASIRGSDRYIFTAAPGDPELIAIELDFAIIDRLFLMTRLGSSGPAVGGIFLLPIDSSDWTVPRHAIGIEAGVRLDTTSGIRTTSRFPPMLGGGYFYTHDSGFHFRLAGVATVATEEDEGLEEGEWREKKSIIPMLRLGFGISF